MTKLLFALVSILAACTTSNPSQERHPAQAEPAVPALTDDLKAVLKYYDPRDAYSAGGYFDWSKCFQPGLGQSTAKAQDGYIVDGCRPDTLYSWQNNDAFNRFKKETSGAKWAVKSHSLFTHIDPVATFGYGFNQIRIHLKPNVKFKVFAMNEQPKSGDFCGSDSVSPQDAPSTVVVRLFGGGTDYILCSTGVIESWSSGTKTAFDEIVAAALWYFEQAPAKNWLPYHEYLPETDGQHFIAPLFISDYEERNFDGHDFSQAAFVQQMTFMRQDTDRGPGEFHYAPGVSPDPVRHFQTSRPVYWNARRF